MAVDLYEVYSLLFSVEAAPDVEAEPSGLELCAGELLSVAGDDESPFGVSGALGS